MGWSLTSLAALCVFVSAFAHADIYTWTDASGRLNVSNVAPPEGARVTHVTREAAPKSDGAAPRETTRDVEVRALAERIKQLEQEIDASKSASPALPSGPAVTAAPPPPVVVTVPVWNYVAPAATDATYAQPSYSGCDFNCAPLWSSFYPASTVIVGKPPFRRPHPLRPMPPRQPHAVEPRPYVAMGKLPLTFAR